MRNNGYYWTYGNICFDSKCWSISFWDGNYFWCHGDDFGEENFEIIDENEIVR